MELQWSDSSTDFCHLKNVLISDIPIVFRIGEKQKKKSKESLFRITLMFLLQVKKNI